MDPGPAVESIAPHFLQNLLPAGLSAPHEAQRGMTGMAAPQPAQNLLPAAFSSPHLMQAAMSPPSFATRRAAKEAHPAGPEAAFEHLGRL
jgi:hypothetical protein